MQQIINGQEYDTQFMRRLRLVPPHNSPNDAVAAYHDRNRNHFLVMSRAIILGDLTQQAYLQLVDGLQYFQDNRWIRVPGKFQLPVLTKPATIGVHGVNELLARIEQGYSANQLVMQFVAEMKKADDRVRQEMFLRNWMKTPVAGVHTHIYPQMRNNGGGTIRCGSLLAAPEERNYESYLLGEDAPYLEVMLSIYCRHVLKIAVFQDHYSWDWRRKPENVREAPILNWGPGGTFCHPYAGEPLGRI